jgi:hypothetical protein
MTHEIFYKEGQKPGFRKYLGTGFDLLKINHLWNLEPSKKVENN